MANNARRVLPRHTRVRKCRRPFEPNLLRNASGSTIAKSCRVPFKLGCESIETALEGWIGGTALSIEDVLDLGYRKQARDAWHSELAEHRAQLHRRPNASEAAR